MAPQQPFNGTIEKELCRCAMYFAIGGVSSILFVHASIQKNKHTYLNGHMPLYSGMDIFQFPFARSDANFGLFLFFRWGLGRGRHSTYYIYIV